MPITATIDRAQRDGLYELIRNHLGAIGDVWIALEESEDYARAERLAREFGEDFRLLEDIGWHPREDRDAFELTMAPYDLIEVLRRLHGEAQEVLSGSSESERRSQEADAETDARFQAGLDVCEKILVGLDEREGERA
jgi:hypothetical protein